MTPEEKIRLAAKMYEAREAARFLFGDKFAERMREGGELLKEAAKATGKSELQCASYLAGVEVKEDRPHSALTILAAAVELAEPSV